MGWSLLLNNPFARVLATLLAFVLAAAAFVAYGGKRERAKAAVRSLKSVAKARDIENEVNGLDEDALRRRASKWVRPE